MHKRKKEIDRAMKTEREKVRKKNFMKLNKKENAFKKKGKREK